MVESVNLRAMISMVASWGHLKCAVTSIHLYSDLKILSGSAPYLLVLVSAS